MSEDSILDETYRVRREIAAEFNDDVHAFFQYLRERESNQAGSVITLDPVVPEVSATDTSR